MSVVKFNIVEKIKPAKNYGEESTPLGVVVGLKIQCVARDLIDTL
jgi:hypothetical protein